MNWLTLITPWMLLVHNTVDFRETGAQEEYYQKLNHVVTGYIEMLENCNNNLRLVNKTGCMDCKIHSLGLQFEARDSRNIDSARKLMLSLVDSFLKTINGSECLRPYLCRHPFTANNIEIRVNFVNDSKYYYPAPNEIKYMSFIDGTITYNTGNPRFLGELEKLREEPLDFARKAVTHY